jgi:hypothetical protein
MTIEAMLREERLETGDVRCRELPGSEAEGKETKINKQAVG